MFPFIEQQFGYIHAAGTSKTVEHGAQAAGGKRLVHEFGKQGEVVVLIYGVAAQQPDGRFAQCILAGGVSRDLASFSKNRPKQGSPAIASPNDRVLPIE